jgi:hypothetical protein
MHACPGWPAAGAAAGATLGVLAHVATMAKEDKAGPNRMLHEATTA